MANALMGGGRQSHKVKVPERRPYEGAHDARAKTLRRCPRCQGEGHFCLIWNNTFRLPVIPKQLTQLRLIGKCPKNVHHLWNLPKDIGLGNSSLNEIHRIDIELKSWPVHEPF